MRPANKTFKIDISKPEDEFEHHINLPGNQRIIFSAPFGTGKTYFLKEFYKEFNPLVFHLYPVNYSVSSNEDIFELIKFDLLCELIKPERGVEFQKIEASLSQNIFMNLNNPSLNDPLSNVINVIPKLGKEFSSALKSLPALVDGLIKKNKLKDDEAEVKKAIREQENNPGNINEINDKTQLIQKLISQLKEKHESDHTKTTLIIDDLDRIDPEHIFRILNVFAAHFDIEEGENKFGFDQVILVCDIENIRKIFAAKYGQEADFSGYIDKFFSREVFEFDNREVIKNSLEGLISKLKVPKDGSRSFYLNQYGTRYFEETKLLMAELVNFNKINLRCLSKIAKDIYPYRYRNISYKNLNIATHNFCYFQILEFLKYYFGSLNSLLEALNSCRTKYKILSNPGELLAIIDWEKHNFKKTDKPIEVWFNQKLYYYNISTDGYNVYVKSVYTDKECKNQANDLPSGELLYQAAKVCAELGVI